MSTIEVEYIGITKAVKKVLWLRRLIAELGVEQSKITLFNDSWSALLSAQNSVYHARTKHIDMRYHRIRELVKKGKVELMKILTKKNQSNALMKVLPKDNFQMCVARMGLLRRVEFTRT